jgi:hypothetical protein
MVASETHGKHFVGQNHKLGRITNWAKSVAKYLRIKAIDSYIRPPTSDHFDEARVDYNSNNRSSSINY